MNIMLAETDKTRLSIEQLNAIDLLVQGTSDAAVGAAVGVSRQTVWHWRNNDPEFVAELNRRREDVWGAATDRLRSLVEEAVNMLEDCMTERRPPSLRLAAAVHVLRAVGLYGSSLKPAGPLSADGVRRQQVCAQFLDGME